GGFRYLAKPAPAAELVGAIRSAVSMHRLALLKRRALELYESERWHFGDRASLEATFEQAIDQLWMAFQPIVNYRKREIIGYEALYSKTSALCSCAPRIVLEVTERSSLDRVSDVKGRAQALRAMGYKLAIDDLGAGYAGLSSFSQLEPDIAKLDMSLVRDIDNSTQKQSIVRSMLDVCRKELGVSVIFEGV